MNHCQSLYKPLPVDRYNRVISQTPKTLQCHVQSQNNLRLHIQKMTYRVIQHHCLT